MRGHPDLELKKEGDWSDYDKTPVLRVRRGHTLREGGGQGVAQVIVYDQKEDMLEGGTDHRVADGAAVGVPGRAATKHTPAPGRQSRLAPAGK